MGLNLGKHKKRGATPHDRINRGNANKPAFFLFPKLLNMASWTCDGFVGFLLVFFVLHLQ